MAEEKITGDAPEPDREDEPELSLRAEHLADTGQISAGHAQRMSGQLVLGAEVDDEVTAPDAPTAPAVPEPTRDRQPGQSPKPAKRSRPRATTPKLKAARDSRPDLKPFPYGTKEE